MNKGNFVPRYGLFMLLFTLSRECNVTSSTEHTATLLVDFSFPGATCECLFHVSKDTTCVAHEIAHNSVGRYLE